MWLSPAVSLMLVLFITIALLSARLTVAVAAASPSEPLFYIYDWPDLVNRYANHTDRPHHSHGVEIPEWRKNHGLGRLVSKNTSEYKTSQFALFKIMYERALIDPRRTLDPAMATTFFIPYDFGMDAAFFETNGRMRRTNCPLGKDAVSRYSLRTACYFLCYCLLFAA
jgi:hypothetical protein